MNSLIEVQKKIVPQVIEQMNKRYSILRQISIRQPIGRRALAVVLDMSERITRAEVDFLKEQDLINISTFGMTITDAGRKLLDDLEYVMNDIMGITDLEKELKNRLGLKFVAISESVGDSQEGTLKTVSKKAARYLAENIRSGDIIAIAGGTTMREVALNVELEVNSNNNDVVVLPTRGSVGSDIDLQANSIAGLLAKNIGSRVEYLYVPDDIDVITRESLMSISELKRTVNDLKNANKIFFSVGRADVMSERRGMSEKDRKKLIDSGAVGEAFGHYFDKEGNIVLKINTIGIDIEMYKNCENPVVVFGGNDKVDSFLALYKINKNISLITDEDSAKEILNKVKVVL